MRAYTTPSPPPPCMHSVTCTSRDTNEHVNPMLEIDNGAVPIPPNYIQNDWPSFTTLNAPRGLAESGLQGYYTCKTEGNTFLSPHLLHSSKYCKTYYNHASVRMHAQARYTVVCLCECACVCVQGRKAGILGRGGG